MNRKWILGFTSLLLIASSARAQLKILEANQLSDFAPVEDTVLFGERHDFGRVFIPPGVRSVYPSTRQTVLLWSIPDKKHTEGVILHCLHPGKSIAEFLKSQIMTAGKMSFCRIYFELM